jgi:hypothetical protein
LILLALHKRRDEYNLVTTLWRNDFRQRSEELTLNELG